MPCSGGTWAPPRPPRAPGCCSETASPQSPRRRRCWRGTHGGTERQLAGSAGQGGETKGTETRQGDVSSEERNGAAPSRPHLLLVWLAVEHPEAAVQARAPAAGVLVEGHAQQAGQRPLARLLHRGLPCRPAAPTSGRRCGGGALLWPALPLGTAATVLWRLSGAQGCLWTNPGAAPKTSRAGTGRRQLRSMTPRLEGAA